ncbi:MAG: hypothetical protein RLZZ360_89 [Candidatus Parcubacteria bacterium]|jgi:hypothetical protein
MSRTNSTFGLLQALASVVGLAILLWSLGLPTFRFAEAANVRLVSDTLSDSAPSVPSNHTISFVTPTGVANGESIVLNFSNGPFALGAVAFDDVDITDDGTDLSVGNGCGGSDEVGFSTTTNTITLQFCPGDGASLPANGTTTIQIGTNATFGATGNAQLTNPAVGSYEIDITAGSVDSGSTRVAIISPVVVTAAVDTSFTFTVSGVATGTVNQEAITGSTSATSIPFGVLTQGSATTSAQQLSVSTNASYGFAVTVEVDQQLLSSTGADIDGFIDGAYTNTPVAWDPPTGTISNENTWGHWGLTTEDASLTAGLTDPFDAGGTGQRFVSASTTPVEVFRHNGPSDGVTPNIGRTRVGYKVEISPLQEAGNDYNATLTYVATPVF